MRRRASTLAILCLLTGACSSGNSSTPGSTASPASPLARQFPVSALPTIDLAAVLSHTKTLASDEFEGRGPGSHGEELTVRYLTDEFQSMGLKPGNTDGTYIQNVPLVGITPRPAPLIVASRDGKGPERQFRWKEDVVAWTKRVVFESTLDRSELVFVGYGVVAPEYGWDDYKGLDVRGKTLVMLVGDPPVMNPAKPGELDPAVFGGKAMTYYGRWTYKFEIAAEKGAAGAFIIHDTESAGYPFDVVQSSWGSEQFDLEPPDRNMKRAAVEGWLSYDAARDVFRQAGHELFEIRKQAVSRTFKPVALGMRASLTIRNRLRNVASRNVVARLEGSDPVRRDEHVVYTAHWDHLGVGQPIDGDAIYNGAQDNAVGVGGLLELARAFTKMPTPPARSILFLAVTAEEQGLLGSEYYASTPIYPLVRTLANINMDGLNVHGRTKDVTVVGYGASDLDDYIREAAAEQGREIRVDPEPQKGFYYRSDHFSFARRGVPALDPDEGVSYVGRPADYGQTVRDEFTRRGYHKPGDVVMPDWDLSGAGEDLQLFLAVGYRVAQTPVAPQWKPGNEFKAKREAMIAYDKEVEAWRAKHEADYTRDYVPLAGLFYLKPGPNSIGSAPTSDVVLPARAPASAGTFFYEAGRVRFEPAAAVPVVRRFSVASGVASSVASGVASSVASSVAPSAAGSATSSTPGDTTITSGISLKSDGEGEPDVLSVHDITFWVHESGSRRTIRISDRQGEAVKAFAGFRWFPIDDRYRVAAKFIKDPKPRQVKVPSLTGDDQEYTTEGLVEFQLDGQTIRMRPMTTRPGRLYFIFRDGTSGRETYEAARFLYADLRPDGTTVLDFNQAYNPPCAFNPFTTCPLPPAENRLTVRIPAGEKAYAGHASLPRASR